MVDDDVVAAVDVDGADAVVDAAVVAVDFVALWLLLLFLLLMLLLLILLMSIAPSAKGKGNSGRQTPKKILALELAASLWKQTWIETYRQRPERNRPLMLNRPLVSR